MYAIVEMVGQQFKVAKDQKVFVHRLQGEEGSKVTFDNVLLLDNGTVTIGAPTIEGAAVTAKILSHLKGDKVIVFKKKRRKGYRKKNGHRQSFTEIQIESIVASGAKKATSAKKETSKKEVVKPKATKKEVAKPKATKKETKTEAVAQDFSSMKVAELRELAKAKGISRISSMKKADLIAALS